MAIIGLMLPTSGYTQDYLDQRTALAEARVPAGADIEFQMSVPPGAPEFLDRGEHFGQAIGAAGSFVSGIEADVIVASGAIDPGLAAVREAVSVPVVGPGEAAMYLGHVIGKPLTVVTVDEFAVARTKMFLDAVTTKPPIASIRSIEIPVRQAMKDFEPVRDALRRECKAAVDEDGAEQIYLGCMIFGTMDIAEPLRQLLGVPVIDPFAVSTDCAIDIAMSLPSAG
jgi:allantoin racemase